MRSILVAEYFAFVVGPALGLTLNDLYPFGDQAGDTAVIKNDDGGSPEIFISTLFPFFNHQHTKLIVSNYIYLVGILQATPSSLTLFLLLRVLLHGG